MSTGIELFGEWLVNQGINLSKADIERFEAFQARLYEVNEVMNLTRVPIDECWIRHFADSLLFQDRFSPGSSVLDLGTGPGFPAWPLACARPDLKVTALDSNRKMIRFLTSNPLPNLKIVEARAEEWRVRNKFHFVTGRALAPLSLQLELSVGPCRLDGIIAPMRTPNEEFEPFDLSILGLKLVQLESRKLPGGDIERVMPSYLKVVTTDRRYPRRWAEMKAKPL